MKDDEPARKKTETAKEPTTPPVQPEAAAPKRRSWNIAPVFWGLLLVLLGILFLLQNLQLATINFGVLWQLWPLLIIAAGISILPVRGWVSALTVSVLIAVSLGLIALAALGVIGPAFNRPVATSDISVSRSSDDLQNAAVSVKSGAGKLNVASDNGERLVQATLQSNFTRVEQTSRQDGSTQRVDIRLANDTAWWVGNYQNDLDVTLTESLPIDLKIDAGASRIQADLSRVMLRRLELDSGASDIDITLGPKQNAMDVGLDVGASSLRLKVPRSAGISVKVDAGLSNTDLPQLKKVGEGEFKSENYDAATQKITITGDLGLSNFELSYY